MTRFATGVLLLSFLAISVVASGSRDLIGDVLRLPSEASRFFRSGGVSEDNDAVGTRWAVLIAGSNGYWNYRHQVFTIPQIISFFWCYLISISFRGIHIFVLREINDSVVWFLYHSVVDQVFVLRKINDSFSFNLILSCYLNIFIPFKIFDIIFSLYFIFWLIDFKL